MAINHQYQGNQGANRIDHLIEAGRRAAGPSSAMTSNLLRARRAGTSAASGDALPKLGDPPP